MVPQMTLREEPDIGKRGISWGGNWFKRFEEGAGQATLCARNYEPSSRAGTKGVETVVELRESTGSQTLKVSKSVSVLLSMRWEPLEGLEQKNYVV